MVVHLDDNTHTLHCDSVAYYADSLLECFKVQIHTTEQVQTLQADYDKIHVNLHDGDTKWEFANCKSTIYSNPIHIGITASGEYTADGRTMSLQELKKWLTLLLDEDLSCTVVVDADSSSTVVVDVDRSYTVVVDADPATEMRAVYDLKSALHKVGILRISYRGAEMPTQTADNTEEPPVSNRKQRS